MLPDGKYAMRTESGDYRLLWLKTIVGDLGRKDRGWFGKRLLYYKIEKGWQDFALLNDDGSLKIHLKFLQTCTQAQLGALHATVASIIENPELARGLYKTLNR